MSIPNRLRALRAQMKKENIQAYIIPSADPHISEYLPDRYKCIEWVSGFTGSAGTLAITETFAGLWTDSRYFVQAQEQLDGTGFELVKLKNQGAPEFIDWVVENLSAGEAVAFDGKLAPILLAQNIVAACAQKNLSVKEGLDLLSPIWEDRPELPKEPAFLLSPLETGQDTASKIEEVYNDIKKKGANYHLISSLDDISWLFNLRGADVKCNPVVLSFALLSPGKTELFIGKDKLSPEDALQLQSSGVQIREYHEVEEALLSIPEGARVFIDPKRNCYAYFNLIPNQVTRILDTNPSTRFKTLKNETELALTRQTMIKDGVALTRFFYWLENTLGKEPITEITIGEKLKTFRAEQEGFVGESFDTIAGYKEHGALPHYKATSQSNATLEKEGLLLIDSGGNTDPEQLTLPE